MRRTFFTSLLVLLFAAGVSAQRNPPMAEQQRDAEKEIHYARFNTLRSGLSADHQRKAYEAGLEYLKRFEGDNDPDARTVRKFVTEYENRGRHFELFTTYNAKNYAKTFELGRALLKKQPENFFTLAILVEAGNDSIFAGNPALIDETVDYARRAVKLIESGKLSSAEPFKNIEVGKGFLNATLGTLLKDKIPVEAAEAFRKAAKSDSFYREDPVIYHRLGVAILKGELTSLSEEYNLKYGAQEPSAAQAEMLKKINQLAGQAIDAYARAVALSDPARANKSGGGVIRELTDISEPVRPQFPAELRPKILAQLTALYKSFNNNSEAGLNELIASVLSKPLP